MRKIIFNFLLLPFLIFASQLKAQDVDPFIQEIIDQLSYDSVHLRLQEFEELGSKEIGTQNLVDTRDWIINFYYLNGYSDIEIDSFYIGQNPVYNIIVSKTGTVYPNTYLIIDGHYDTYNGPGVNDNGSGTAIVLEIARVLQDIETEYSIKFIHFTAEEIGLVGSTHYVENIVIPEEMDIRLVLNIDEVGGVAGEVNNTITCERDEWSPTGNNAASAAFTDTLANLTEMYSSLSTTISYAYGSDYVPFMNNNYVVTGLYETNESPYTHSPSDILSNLDPEYVFEVTKASTAASLYFSGYLNSSTGITESSGISYDFNISPNPFIDYFELENPTDKTLQIIFFDLSGKEVFKSIIKANTKEKLRPDFDQGMYLFYIFSIKGEVFYSDKIIKK